VGHVDRTTIKRKQRRLQRRRRRMRDNKRKVGHDGQ
jgi:hypothetical protein